MTQIANEPWTPAAEHRNRWERLGLLRDLVEGAAWGRPIDDPSELARRETRVRGVLEAMTETAPEGYFHDRPLTREAEMREMGYTPLDATDEELVTVWEAHKAGYAGYTVKTLRENRAKALPAFDGS
jgi:hypothetical protein